MKNLTELSKEVYQLQIDKGWCKPDQVRNQEDLKVLILSEAFEAFEGYRGNKYTALTKSKLKTLLQELNNHTQYEECLGEFKGFVKDTFEDEIADVAIRALDLAGYLDKEVYRMENSYEVKTKDFPIHLINLVKLINSNFDKGLASYHLSLILDWCFAMAKRYDFDLMLHIDLKLAYNKTRPFRHGNKVV